MAKKIIIISSGPIFIALALMAIVFVGIGYGQATSIDSARTQIIELADSNKLPEMDIAIDKFITDYSGNSQLTTNLYIIADSFVWRRLYDRSETLFHLVLDKSKNASLTTKARLGISRVEIIDLIGQKKFTAAKEQLDSIVIDFRNEPDLAVALMQIGQEFTWIRKYVESKKAFDYLGNDFANSSYGKQGKLWSSRTNICILINDGKTKNKDISTAIDKFIEDFNSDSGVADALYWIAREYEWTNGTKTDRNAWYDMPNGIYQTLVERFNYEPAKWDYKRLSYRMKIFNLIKENDQNSIDTLVDSLIKEFTGRPELPGELYWIACGYEEQSASVGKAEKGPQAIQIYQRIIKEFPNTEMANKSLLDIQRRNIWDILIGGDINGAEILMDKYLVDFNQNPYAGDCLGRIVLGCFAAANEYKSKDQKEQAKIYYEEAINIWQRLSKNNLFSQNEDTLYLNFYIAGIYQQLNRYEEAILSYQNILDNHPDFKYACGIQAAIGHCYELLRDSNAITKEEANPLIEQAWEVMLNNYPGCYSTPEIAYHLAEMKLEKGDNTSAVIYYQKFLKTARPQDGRIQAIKIMLSKMEGTGK